VIRAPATKCLENKRWEEGAIGCIQKEFTIEKVRLTK